MLANDSDSSDSNSSKSIKHESLSSERKPRRQGMQQDRKRKRSHPQVAVDDDISSQLLRPSAQRIISQLNQTLTILDDMGRTVEDKSHGSPSDTSENQKTPKIKRGRGRPRTNVDLETSRLTSPPPKTSKRGRPKKVHIPREGESQTEMKIRVAREGHRPLPVWKKEVGFQAWLQASEHESANNDTSNKESGNDTNGETIPQPSDTWEDDSENEQDHALHDWSTVLSAASLAGFAPEVISRATQRCVDLFSSSSSTVPDTALQHINKTLPLVQKPGMRNKTFTPKPIPALYQYSSSDSAEEEEAQENIKSGSQTPLSRSRSQSRSRSRSKSPGVLICPVAGCHRAVEGFSKPANLRRHVKLVHPMWEGDVEVDSEDEMLGGVHRDGFLKPLRPGKGWIWDAKDDGLGGIISGMDD